MDYAWEMSKTSGIPIPNMTLAAIATAEMYQAINFQTALGKWEEDFT